MIEIHKSEWCNKLHNMHDWFAWRDVRRWFNLRVKTQVRRCDRCFRREERDVYVENG